VHEDLPSQVGAIPSAPVDREQTQRRLYAAVYARYEERLRLAGSPIVGDRNAVEQLQLQVSSVVADVLEEYWSGRASLPALAPALSADIGTARASAGVHPSDSLAAASLLFDSVLEVVEEELPAADTGALSRSLNRIISSRMVWAAVAYVDVLLRKLRDSHDEERRRISRELHDRVAHAVGAGLQNIEMYRLYRDEDADKAAMKLAIAVETLMEALELIRDLAAGLRDPVGAEGLVGALESYLVQHAPAGLRTSVTSTGPVDDLTPQLRDELYIVLREAVRNAFVHGRPRHVGVSIAVSDADIMAEVVDDGIGFAQDDELAAPSGIGLSSMRERLTLLGGTITWSSSASGGTVVRVAVERDWLRS
jgi:signal transduction histidine kinase